MNVVCTMDQGVKNVAGASGNNDKRGSYGKVLVFGKLAPHIGISR